MWNERIVDIERTSTLVPTTARNRSPERRIADKPPYAQSRQADTKGYGQTFDNCLQIGSLLYA